MWMAADRGRMGHTVGFARTISRFLTMAVLLCPAPRAADAPAHFHHLHLNSTDPDKAIEFYTNTFDCERAKFAAAVDGVWAQKSWLLFTRTASAPPAATTSAIWHFGWGAENMPDAYQKQLATGTPFGTPITQLFPKFWYAYVDGPDHAIIELNTSANHNFGHLHLISADAVSAGEWYQKHFGATWKSGKPPTREPRFIKGFQIGPASSLMMDNVNIIIFPIEYARQAMPEWKNRTEFESPKGRVVDHVGFSVDNLAGSLEALRKDGVKVTGEIKSAAGGKIKYAFIEGPDRIRIELIEGQAHKE
jgi:catechol 2,3-dioxygenase-like lactoylglutathione lyase family enzyme